MMEWSNFAKQYVKNPSRVGAIAPSSEKLANRMVEDICFFTASCIVEYGPGTGAFTEKILEQKNDDTLFIAIENNKEFYEILKDRFKEEKKFILVNGSAENVNEYLDEYNIHKIDYVVSGLPFASLPESMSRRILSVTKEMLGAEGEFITFQYTLFKMKLFRRYFKNIEREKVLLNLPPAYVLKCKNKQ